MTLHWLFEYDERGGHTHVKVRCGPQDHGRGLAGTLVFRNEEWEMLQALLTMAENDSNRMEFRKMDPEVAEIARARAVRAEGDMS